MPPSLEVPEAIISIIIFLSAGQIFWLRGTDIISIKRCKFGCLKTD